MQDYQMLNNREQMAHKDIYVLSKLSIWLCIIISVRARETHSEAHLAVKDGHLS